MIFSGHIFSLISETGKNIFMIICLCQSWICLCQSWIRQLTHIWNETYRICYNMHCVMDYIQSTISMHIPLSQVLFQYADTCYGRMFQCFNKMCIKLTEYLNVSVKCTFNFSFYPTFLCQFLLTFFCVFLFSWNFLSSKNHENKMLPKQVFYIKPTLPALCCCCCVVLFPSTVNV